MRANNLKINEHQTIDEQIADFFSRGGAIQEVPTNIYKREELSLTNKAVMLETSPSKVTHDRSKSGRAIREVDRISWEKRKMAGK